MISLEPHALSSRLVAATVVSMQQNCHVANSWFAQNATSCTTACC
jgi:hypothetical protein